MHTFSPEQVVPAASGAPLPGNEPIPPFMPTSWAAGVVSAAERVLLCCTQVPMASNSCYVYEIVLFWPRRLCGGAGMHVFLADIDARMLPEAESEIHSLASPHGGSCSGVVTDVSDAESVASLRNTVLATHSTVHFLHCNAGLEVPGGVREALSSWETTLGVNLFGVVHTTKAFLERMIERGQPGVIVCTGSKQGITMPPGNLAYNVSKAGVKAFAEGLQHELRNTPDCKLSAHLCVPGFVNSMIRVKSQRYAPLSYVAMRYNRNFFMRACVSQCRSSRCCSYHSSWKRSIYG